MSKTKPTEIIVRKPAPSGPTLPSTCDWNNVETDFTILQESSTIPGIYTLDAFVHDSRLKRLLGFEIDEERRDAFLRQLADFERQTELWTGTRSATVVFIGQKPAAQRPIPSSPNLDWAHSPSLILNKLESSEVSAEERRIAVLFAETLAFTASEQSRVLVALSAYIDRYRLGDQDAQTAMATQTAIRKFAMNMKAEHFDAYAGWFAPTATETISTDLELELAKAICARLTYEPVATGASWPLLSQTLASLATDYLTPRLVLQKNFASIAANATVATFLLAASSGQRDDVSEVAKRMVEVNIKWFVELVDRQLDEAASAIEPKNAETAASLRALTKSLL